MYVINIFTYKSYIYILKNALLKPFGEIGVLGSMSHPFSLRGPAINLSLLPPRKKKLYSFSCDIM